MRVARLSRCTVGGAVGAPVLPSTPSGPSTSTSLNSTLHALRTRDITLLVPSKDHMVRISYCSTRRLLAETIRRHDLLRNTSAHLDFLQLLGTNLTFANVLASARDGEERVETRFTAEEATILVEALALGECRCYVRPEYNAQLEERGLPTFPLHVHHILYRQQRPFSSVVHANLAELLQAPSPPTDAPDTAAGAANDVREAVPFSLFTPGMADRVPVEAWKRFFSYSISPHAYNYLRRSDGCTPAVWMYTSLNSARLAKHGLVGEDGVVLSTQGNRADGCGTIEEEEKAVREFQRALQDSTPHSFGVIVSPLAAGAEVDRQVGHLNRVLMEASALLYNPQSVGSIFSSPLTPLLNRCAETHTTCQHIFSLISGDYEGAYKAAEVARQYCEDPAGVAAVVDPIRRRLGLCETVIPLAGAEAVRTGLDFFCRCSKQNILDSLVSAPMSALRSLRESDSLVHCSCCGKRHQLAAADWQELEKKRSAVHHSANDTSQPPYSPFLP